MAASLADRIKLARREVTDAEKKASATFSAYTNEKTLAGADAWADAEDHRACALGELVELLDEALNDISRLADCGE